MQSENCIFCRDVLGKRHAVFVFENDRVAAFMDIAPVEPGHCLVIPKRHFRDILDIDYEDYLEVHRVTKMLTPAVVRAVNADGVNIGQNNGASANQRVFHYHVHIIPRFIDREILWGRKVVLQRDLEDVAESIKSQLNNPNLGKIILK
ncbi:MAG TPA: HIT family protein [Thermoplasmataceae archaeon]|nr:HIT family protein [Thermoplasmatales archaeon AK]HLH86749.1 HIT family protein [Thermoplasmataceae archaeon]